MRVSHALFFAGASAASHADSEGAGRASFDGAQLSESQPGFTVVSGECTTEGLCAMSPNFPEHYSNNQLCTLQVSSAGVVTADVFDTESFEDVLSIAGRDFSGADGPQNVSTSSGAEISWRSDFSITNSGWRICEQVGQFPEAGTLGFSVTSGECEVNGACATSPNYPENYGANQDCSLRVLTRELVTASSFSTEMCCDHLTVADTIYAGSSGPDHVLILEGDDIQWRSDFSFQRSGWQICASHAAPAPVPVPGAPPMFSLDSGPCTVSTDGSCAMSPGYPDNYDNDQNCRMELINSDGIISADHFQTEQGLDFLSFTSGDAFSGSHGPNNEYATVGEGISWHSDYSISYSGWKVCVSEAPHLSPPSGVFNVTSGDCTLSGDCVLSPHFPLSYDNNQECRIRANAGGSVTSVVFHLESGYDHLQVGGNRFTGNIGPDGMYILDGMTMHFSTDFSNTNQGFMVCLRPEAPEHVTPAPSQAEPVLGSIYCEHGCSELTMEGGPSGLIISTSSTSSGTASPGALVSLQGESVVIFTQVNLGEEGVIALDGSSVSRAGPTLLGSGNHTLSWSGGGEWLAVVLPTTGGCDDFSEGFVSGCSSSSPAQKLFGTDDLRERDRCREHCLEHATSHVSGICCDFGFRDRSLGCYAVPNGTVASGGHTLGYAALCSPQRPVVGATRPEIVSLIEGRAQDVEIAARSATKMAKKPLPQHLASKPRPAKEQQSGLALADGAIWVVVPAAAASFFIAVVFAAVRSRGRAMTGSAANPLLHSA